MEKVEGRPRAAGPEAAAVRRPPWGEGLLGRVFLGCWQEEGGEVELVSEPCAPQTWAVRP